MELLEKISFLVPVYNSKPTIEMVVRRIAAAVHTLETPVDFEIVLVDDGSRDGVYDVCRALAVELPYVRPFQLARNFGQANALMAGLNQITGDYVVCLDDDLQTPPEEFIKLYHTMQSGGFDVVYGYYEHKKHSAFRNFGTSLNESMQTFILNKPCNIHTSSYFIAKRYVVDIVKQYDKPFPYLPGLFLLMTGSVASVPIHHDARHEGRSGYGLVKLLELWLNGFTNFSVKPLRIASFAGTIIALVAFVMMIVLFILKLSGQDIQMGWTSTIVILLFIGGVQLLSVGILGEYIGRIYLSVNQTPQYVIKPESPHAADNTAARVGQTEKKPERV
ncbi:MAG: glycosyltransferase family 2 protein [Ethanoligenens sp.]